MDAVLYLYAIVIVLTATLATITVWAPRKLWIRVTAVICAGLLMPTAYASLNELLSRPKPMSLEWARKAVDDATVVSSKIEEGEAIYLWLQIADMDEPRAYVLPWNKNVAKQLHQAEREVGRRGGNVGMRQPFESTLDESQPKFYARPQARAPMKPPPGDAPVQYQHPRQGS